MADENKVTLSFEVDSKDLEKTLDNVQKSTKKAVQDSEKELSGFGGFAKNFATGFQAAFGFFTAGALVDGIKAFGKALKSAVDEAAEADQNLRNLAVSFAQTGEFSEAAVKQIEDFASVIQKTTVFTDDAVIAGVTLAKSFGLSNDQARELTAAAVDLAATTGKDLDTAVKELGGTYSGTTGRLEKQIPALKNLSAEQLKNGEAIKIVQKAYQDAAKAQAEGTFAGALTKTRNAFNEIFEAAGKIITQNPVLIAIINNLGEAFSRVSDFLAANQDTITSFLSKGLKGLVAFIPSVVNGFGHIVEVIQFAVRAIGALIKGFVVVGDTILELTKPIRDFQNIIGNALIGSISKFLSFVAEIVQIIPGAEKALEGFGISLEALKSGFDAVGDEDLKKALELDTSASDSFQEFAKTALESIFLVTEKSEESISGFLDRVKDQTDSLAESLEGVSDNIQKVGDKSTGVTGGIKNQAAPEKSSKDILAGFTDFFSSITGVLDQIQGLIDAIPNLLTKVTKIFDSLVDLPNKILEGIVNLFRSIGRFISEFIPNLFRAVPQIISEVIKALATSIPDAIEALAKSLPEIIEGLIQNLEELVAPLVEALITAAPKITLALVDAFITKGGAVKIAVALTKALSNPQLYLNIARGILAGFAGLGNTIANQFKAGVANVGKDMSSDFVAGIQSIFPQIGAAFTNAGQIIYGFIVSAFQNVFSQLYSIIISAFQAIYTALTDTIRFGFISIFESLKTAIQDGFSNSFEGIKNAIGEGGVRLRDAFFKPVNKLIDFLSNFSFPAITGGLGDLGGGVGGAVGGIVNTVTSGGGIFASGGLVPEGFPNDTFNARMTSGELVIPPGDTERLSSFLDNNEKPSDSGLIVANLLAQILASLNQPMSVSTTAEVNGRELANIMLNLSRNNARVSV